MLVLEVADEVPVVHDILGASHVAVHHGRGGSEPLTMSLAMDVEPGPRPALLGLDAPAHALGQDFRPASGQGRLSGHLEPGEHLGMESFETSPWS